MESAAKSEWGPGEFRYFERRRTAAARALRLAGRLFLGFDPEPDEELAQRFRQSYYDGDPIAEAYVAELCGDGHFDRGRQLLDRALSEGIDAIDDAPGSLRDLFEDIRQAPDWLDPEAVSRGARCFRRYGTSVFRFAGTVTLRGYAENSVAKPLALTGGYLDESAKQRFLETASFWIDISEPGGLEAGAPGWTTALRVRLLHVFVRQRLSAHAEWDQAAWGLPISQADAMVTLLGGSLIPGLALKTLGYRPTKGELEDMLHFWRYVGHLMGVRPRCFPKNLREATQLAYLVLLRGADGSGDDGVRLCQSYARAFEVEGEGSLSRRLEAKLENGLQLAYLRLFSLPDTVRKNQLPSAGLWPMLPLAMAPAVWSAETLRRRIPALESVADRIARAQRRRWLDRQLGKRQATYRARAEMTR